MQKGDCFIEHSNRSAPFWENLCLPGVAVFCCVCSDCDGFPHFILDDWKSKDLGILNAWPQSLVFSCSIAEWPWAYMYVPLALLVLVFFVCRPEKNILSYYLYSSRSPSGIPRGLIHLYPVCVHNESRSFFLPIVGQKWWRIQKTQVLSQQ